MLSAGIAAFERNITGQHKGVCPGAVSYTHLDVYKRQIYGVGTNLSALRLSV